MGSLKPKAESRKPKAQSPKPAKAKSQKPSVYSTPMSPLRPLGVALGAAVVIAIAGAAWERTRFGADDAAAASHLEREVRSVVGDRADRVVALGNRVAAEQALIARSVASDDELAALFGRVTGLARTPPQPSVAVSVYEARAGTFRVLAWSDGPAGDVATYRLSGPAALFVAPGTGG